MARTIRIMLVEPVEGADYPAGTLRIRFLMVEEGHEIETVLKPPITIAHAREKVEAILARIPLHPLHKWVGREFTFE